MHPIAHEEFRSIEASLYQVLHRTTSNELQRIVQQTRGQKVIEAWHAIVRRYDQRNMSDKDLAFAALISNISEKHRAKDVEQSDDIPRTLTNEMNKLENRFGKIRDEEKMLAVRNMLPESLLNYRFRGATMSYSEIIIALGNIIVDKVSTVPSSKSRRNDTSPPMEIGMAAKEDGETVSQEGNQRIIDLALQAVYKGTGKGKWSFSKGQNWNEKGGKGGEERTRGRRATARKEEKGKRKVAWENPERVGRAARQDTLQLGVEKKETNMYTPLTKTTVRTLKNRPKMRRICKHGACWKKANMNSGRRCSADGTSKG